MTRELLILQETEIRSLLDPVECIAAVEQAFTAYSTGRAELPGVIHLDVRENRGEIHVKAGHISGGTFYAVKIVSGFSGNPERALRAIDGMIVVFDAATGAPAALLLDHGFITEARTAAAGAVAAKHLARREVSTVAVIGSGGQARYQVQFLAHVRNFREVRIFGRHADRAAACAEELSQYFAAKRSKAPAPNFVPAGSVGEALAGAEIVITVTSSREPLVRAADVAAGALVIAVGSDNPDKQELDVDVLARADRIVADSLPQCLRMGEIHHAVEKGSIAKDRVDAELGEITAGLKAGRRSDDELIVCDLTGVGVQDVASASLILERALRSARGERVIL